MAKAKIKKRKPGSKLSLADERFVELYAEYFKNHEDEDLRGLQIIGDPHESYEPIMLRGTGGVRWTPDFACKNNNDEIVLVEVKGSRRQRNFYYSRARMAATIGMLGIFHCVIVEAKADTKSWRIEKL